MYMVYMMNRYIALSIAFFVLKKMWRATIPPQRLISNAPIKREQGRSMDQILSHDQRMKPPFPERHQRIRNELEPNQTKYETVENRMIERNCND